MVTETKFDSLFDYSSVFKYDSITPLSKGVNRSFYRSAFTYHSVNINTDSDEDKAEEESYGTLILRKSITLLFYLLVILSFPISSWICVKKIPALERIVLMRLGKLQAVRGPGFALILPVIDTWTRVNVRPQSFTVSISQVSTADGGIVEIKSDIEYQVSNVIDYVMKLRKQERTLKELGSLCVRNIISEKDQDDLENKRDLMSSFLKDELNRSALNWGLEILNVHLYSPKILKPAEPVDALGTLMIALKAATGHSSEHTAAVFPVFPGERTSNKTADIYTEQNTSVIDILKSTICNAEKKGLLTDMTANFKFDIVAHTTETVYCIFKKGEAYVVDDPSFEVESDVSLIISEDNMRDFLCGRISPMEAYMEGKVMVTGDWSLLRPLAKILEESLR